MLKKRIIPCLDVKNGRVVKGVNFVGLKDAGDPVEIAMRYDAEGADEICFLDITASSDKRDIMLDVVRRTAQGIFVPLTVGGGVRTLDDIKSILRAGADKVAINTAAVTDPELIRMASQKFGNQCIVVAIDAKRSVSPGIASGFEVYIHGGRTPTGRDVLAWAKQVQDFGAGEILLTSMDRDGTKSGYDLELTAMVASRLNIPVIASGGVGTREHILAGFKTGQASAVLAASVFHFGEISIGQVKDYLLAHQILVRK